MNNKPNSIQLFKNIDNIEEGISDHFINILKNCSNPHIVCMYGDSKIGITSKLNQIINGINSSNYFNLKEPFEKLEELESDTSAIKPNNKIYGPININYLIQNNDIKETEISKDIINDELFFVELNNVEEINTSNLYSFLSILQFSSVIILNTYNIDNAKLGEIDKFKKLSHLLNISNNEGKTINLISDFPLNEKEESKMIQEIENKKNILNNQIDNYYKKINSDSKVTCEILPSYDLALNDLGDYAKCYKYQMENLILSIISNLKYNKEINGNKLLDIINESIEKLKKIKTIENIRNSGNIINIIILELFKEKVNRIYLNIIDKINKFDKNIICMKGKNSLIQNYIINEIKNELKNNWDIYDNVIHNEICIIIEINTLKINIAINEIFNKIKNDINKDIILISNIKENNKLLEFFSKFHYKEEINLNDINNIIEQEIKSLLSKYEIFFECIDNINEDYKKNIISCLKSYLLNNINELIEQKCKWEETLKMYMTDIEVNIINKYKNKLLEEKSFRDIERHIKNNLQKLRDEVDNYIQNNKFIIYNKDDYINKLENLFNKTKNELNLNLLILKEKNEKIIQKSIPDGIYNIIPKHCENKAIEVKDYGTDNMDNLQLGEFINSNSQMFEIKYNSLNQFYTIKSLFSYKALSVDYTNNDNVIQNNGSYGNDQQWHIVSVGDNYEIISEMNGNLIEVNETNYGVNFSCKPKTGQLNQQFKFIPTTKEQFFSQPQQIKFITTTKEQFFSQPQPQPQCSFINYFPKTPYDGFSIVDGLKKIGAESSYNYRCKIALKNGIQGYKGTPNQNIEMLNLLKQGLLIKPDSN